MGGGGGGTADLKVVPNPDAFWASDPPLMMCGADGVPMSPQSPPGGTPECPDDKNREGCPCNTPGMTAKCWPGLRANRNLGICMDGQTTCMAGEVTNTWGPCKGYVLPAAGATTGKDACQCFSNGTVAFGNVQPFILYGPAIKACTTIDDCAAGQHCFTEQNGSKTCRVAGANGAMSTLTNGGYPTNIDVKPTEPWSTVTAKVDCQGTMEFCYTIKAGDAKNPQASDCTLVTKCSKGTYTGNGTQTMTFPALESWIDKSDAAKTCAQRFALVGGYGEMTVNGKSVTCDPIGPKLFNRLPYCPAKCVVDPRTANQAECLNCSKGGGGNF